MNGIDGVVESAAMSFYMSGPGGIDEHWDDLPNARKAHFRNRARIALEAALPSLLTEAWDEGAKAADGKWLVLQHNPYRINQ